MFTAMNIEYNILIIDIVNIHLCIIHKTRACKCCEFMT